MNEELEEELERANLERQAIVKKYKLGRDLENKINEWVSWSRRGDCELFIDISRCTQEDPDFGLHYKIDR